jgi:flavin reductase (DIM6/NTAB) family NADH-FMN oxidoreductase RutF
VSSGYTPAMALTQDFKNALSAWASGVAVVTTNDNGLLYGLTVSSFSALSLDPPLILVCLGHANRMAPMIASSGGFAVSILRKDQQSASQYFARTGRLPTADFVEIEGQWTSTGQPVVAGALAWLVCTAHRAIEEGDHTIVIGRVVEASTAADGEPLLYWRRAYRAFG